MLQALGRFSASFPRSPAHDRRRGRTRYPACGGRGSGTPESSSPPSPPPPEERDTRIVSPIPSNNQNTGTQPSSNGALERRTGLGHAQVRLASHLKAQPAGGTRLPPSRRRSLCFTEILKSWKPLTIEERSPPQWTPPEPPGWPLPLLQQAQLSSEPAFMPMPQRSAVVRSHLSDFPDPVVKLTDVARVSRATAPSPA